METFIIVIQHCFTGKDGKTTDVARVFWALGILTFLGLAILASIQHQPWHPTEFGMGFGAVMAGGGIGVGAKAKTEPEG